MTVTAVPTGLGDGQQWLTNLTIRGYDSDDDLVETIIISVTLSAGKIWNNPLVGEPSQIYLPFVTNP